jgi:hypothetical protein
MFAADASFKIRIQALGVSRFMSPNKRISDVDPEVSENRHAGAESNRNGPHGNLDTALALRQQNALTKDSDVSSIFAGGFYAYLVREFGIISLFWE